MHSTDDAFTAAGAAAACGQTNEQTPTYVLTFVLYAIFNSHSGDRLNRKQDQVKHLEIGYVMNCSIIKNIHKCLIGNASEMIILYTLMGFFMLAWLSCTTCNKMFVYLIVIELKIKAASCADDAIKQRKRFIFVSLWPTFSTIYLLLLPLLGTKLIDR